MKKWLKNGKQMLINGKLMLCPDCSCDQCKEFGFWIQTNNKVYVGSTLPEGKTGTLYATLQEAIDNEDNAKIYVRASTISNTVDCKSKRNWIKAYHGEKVVLQKGAVNGHNSASYPDRTMFENIECEIANVWDAGFLNCYFHNIHTDGTEYVPGTHVLDIYVAAKCACVFDDMSTGNAVLAPGDYWNGGKFNIDNTHFCRFSNFVFGDGRPGTGGYGGGFDPGTSTYFQGTQYLYDCIFENIVFGNGAYGWSESGGGGGGGFGRGGSGDARYSVTQPQSVRDIYRCIFRNIVFGNGADSPGNAGGGGGFGAGGGGGAATYGGQATTMVDCIFENLIFGRGGYGGTDCGAGADNGHGGGGAGFGGGCGGISSGYTFTRGGDFQVITGCTFNDIVFGNGGNGNIDGTGNTACGGGAGGFGGGAGGFAYNPAWVAAYPHGGLSQFCDMGANKACTFEKITWGNGGNSQTSDPGVTTVYNGFKGGYGGNGFIGGNVTSPTFLQPGIGLPAIGGADGVWATCA